MFSGSFFRLDDADGNALGVCAMAIDVTDSRRARERLTLLSEASTRIGSTLDVMQTAQELADFAVPLLADYVTVDLVDSVPLGEEPPARLATPGRSIPVFRRAGLASIHEGSPESLWERGEAVFVRRRSPFAERSCVTGRPLLEATWPSVPAPGSTTTRHGRRRSGSSACTR